MNDDQRFWVWITASLLLLWPVFCATAWPWSSADRLGMVLMAGAIAYVVVQCVAKVRR